MLKPGKNTPQTPNKLKPKRPRRGRQCADLKSKPNYRIKLPNSTEYTSPDADSLPLPSSDWMNGEKCT